MKSQRGFSLIEILIVAALCGAVFLAFSNLVAPALKFLHRNQARQQLQTQARGCLDTMDRVISNGRAATVTISNSPTIPSLPAAQLQFQSVDNSSYTITFSSVPINSVHLLHTPFGSLVTTDTVLATNVSVLSFAWSPSDPSIMNVTLIMIVPMDSSGTPDSFYKIQLPAQTIRMVSS
jgi:prepilin-type N-terminal cleavage/methylation domain-containing protein